MKNLLRKHPVAVFFIVPFSGAIGYTSVYAFVDFVLSGSHNHSFWEILLFGILGYFFVPSHFEKIYGEEVYLYLVLFTHGLALGFLRALIGVIYISLKNSRNNIHNEKN